MTAAEKAEAISKLEVILRIFQRVPELAHPQGFVVDALLSGASQRLGPGDKEVPGYVFEYRLHLGLRDPAVEMYGCGSIEVRVNFSDPPGNLPIHDAQGRPIYFEDVRGDGYFNGSRDPNNRRDKRDKVPFATETFYRLSPTERSWVDPIFTAGGELPWKSVSREEYYNALVFDVEGNDGQKLAAYRKSLEKSPYRQWLDGAAQRKKERDEALTAVATVQTPAEVAKLRKEMEDTERQVGEQLKAEEAADPDANAKALADSHSFQDGVRAELARMTPAQRRAPAMIDATQEAGFKAGGFTLADHDGPFAQRIFTLNYDSWRRSLWSPVRAGRPGR